MINHSSKNRHMTSQDQSFGLSRLIGHLPQELLFRMSLNKYSLLKSFFAPWLDYKCKAGMPNFTRHTRFL